MNFPNASEATKRLNPHLFNLGGVPAAQPQRDGRVQPARPDGPQTGSPRRLVVCLVGHRRVLLDDDNFVGACKHLRDAIAATLGLDDGDKRIRWEYSQHETRGHEGVAVSIQVL